ncbi:MAG: glycine cleavage system aminomethyltransferase GcvT [Actinomycetota bacterium]
MVLTTPLNEEHVALGASFTDFGGWNMPVRYGSDLAEHHAVRTSAGLFDISHMGELRLRGPEATKFLDQVLVSNIAILKIGQAKYSLICSMDGSVIDDLIVYKLAEDDYLVVANASNRHAVITAMQDLMDYGFKVELEDQTEDWGLIAIQGPKAAGILQRVVDVDLSTLKYYSIAEATLDGVKVYLARTGYTGEDGFEIFVPEAASVSTWRKLLEVGGEELMPCGLASRDTLRLEAGMPLYGHELSREITIFEAGLGRVVAFDKGEFFTRTILFKQASQLKQKLYGLVGDGKRAARADYEIYLPGGSEPIGKVTSGALSPTLGYPIAIAMLRADLDLPIDSALEADVRGTRVPYKVVKLPFYKRER